MRSVSVYSKLAFKTAITFMLSASLLLPLADAKTKTPAESIPPSVRVSPDLIRPTDQPDPALKQPPVTAQHTEQTPVIPALDPVQALVDRGIFPADAMTRTAPFSRAELASILVKALGHKTNMVSEFPFYRDVPTEHWAYVPIEVARAKKLLEYSNDHGFYYPDRPIVYGDVYGAVAQAITGPPPSKEVAKHLLEDFLDQDTISEEMIPAVAKIARARLFGHTGITTGSKPVLRPNETVHPDGLAPLVIALMHLIEHRAPLIAEEDIPAPILPAGMTLSVTPATAIFEGRLSVGEDLSFTLLNPVEPLPKGSRVQGMVRETLMNHTFIIELSEVVTPEGISYRTSADITLTFSPKEKTGFFVPGEVFTATTQIPRNVAPNAMPLPLLSPPSESSGNRAAPNSSPRSPE